MIELESNKKSSPVEQRHIENHLLITNKDRKTVKFHLNDVQKQYLQNRTHRDIILKARQEGFSSLIDALFLIDCLKVPNTRSVVISHDIESTQKLLDRVKLYIERFYEEEDFISIPTKLNNRNEIYFEETNSTFYIGTAGSRSFGRGDTINNLHLSELAFYPDVDEVLTSTLAAVPENGYVVIETTANGFNLFKHHWERAKQQKSTFKPHFFSWWQHREYQRNESLESEYTQEEKNLIARFHLTDAQLSWRRYKIKEMPSMEKFHQEYPADDFEAFVSSGNPVFNQQVLKNYLARCKEPLAKGYVAKEGSFTPDEDGFVWIWEWPDANDSYVIGADVAEGLEHGDYSSAKVLSRQTMRVVAKIRVHLDPDVFAEQLEGMGRLYNYAVIGCEANNHGLSVNNTLQRNGYTNIYKRQILNKITKSTVNALGWITNMKTKPLMIDDLNQALREESLDVPDQSTIEELLSYQRDAKGSMNAPEGMFDDQVIDTAIAVQMRKLTSPLSQRVIPEYSHGTAGHFFQGVIRQKSSEDVIGNS